MSSESSDNFDEESDEEFEDSSEDDEDLQRAKDLDLLQAVIRNEAAAVQQALGNGANVNCSSGSAPLMEACKAGYDDIVRILLDAGADARYRTDEDWSAMKKACGKGHLSTIDLLLNHDNGLLETEDRYGYTP